MEQFIFLEKNDFWYETNTSTRQFLYKFKDQNHRGLIGVPVNAYSSFWYKYFIKGDADSYHKNTPVEELPGWFQQLVISSSEMINRRDRIEKLFIEKKIQKSSF